MGTPVSEIYNLAAELLLKEANGDLSFDLFNEFSPSAELKVMEWITGDMAGQQPPEPYVTQKNRDWLTPFIEKFPTTVNQGMIIRPDNYYGFENMYLLGAYNTPTECDNEDEETEQQLQCNTPIELLDAVQFYVRCNTYIEGLQPSFKRPIAKEIGRKFEFLPKDLGSIVLEYYRYPKFAKIVPTVDPVYNTEIIDVNASTNYEWDLKTKNLLVYFIVDAVANRTSNQAQKQFNELSKDIRK